MTVTVRVTGENGGRRRVAYYKRLSRTAVGCGADPQRFRGSAGPNTTPQEPLESLGGEVPGSAETRTQSKIASLGKGGQVEERSFATGRRSLVARLIVVGWLPGEGTRAGRIGARLLAVAGLG